MSGQRLLAVAHRAGNHLDALREAEEMGVDLVEADVHWFFGRLEVRHEKTLGPLPILWERWRLISPFTPRLLLPTLLAEAATGTELMLDLKGLDPRLAKAVARLIGDRPAQTAIAVSARNWWLLKPFSPIAGVRCIRSIGSRLQLRVLLHLTRARLDGVSIHESLLDAATVRALHRRTNLIITWGARTHQRVDELHALGVDGITTEDSEILRYIVGTDPAEASGSGT